MVSGRSGGDVSRRRIRTASHPENCQWQDLQRCRRSHCFGTSRKETDSPWQIKRSRRRFNRSESLSIPTTTPASTKRSSSHSSSSKSSCLRSSSCMPQLSRSLRLLPARPNTENKSRPAQDTQIPSETWQSIHGAHRERTRSKKLAGTRKRLCNLQKTLSTGQQLLAASPAHLCRDASIPDAAPSERREYLDQKPSDLAFRVR